MGVERRDKGSALFHINDCVIRLQCRSPLVTRCGNPRYLLFPVVLTGFIDTIDNGDNFSAHATILIQQ